MEIDYKFPVIIFLSYFLLIATLLFKISPQLKKSYDQYSPDITLFFVLTSISLLGFHWEFSINAISHWLHDTSLIKIFCRQASVGTWQWLWTHQLGTFATAVWTPLLAIEGWKRRIPHLWAYLLLGELMGISSASGLFFAVMLSHPQTRKRPSSKLLATLGFSVAIGLMLLSILPALAKSGDGLQLVLLAIHVVLNLPLIFNFSESNVSTVYDGTPKWIALFYSLFAGANLCIYLQEWGMGLLALDKSNILCGLFSILWSTFFEHPAQTVINSDITAVNIISVAWMLSHSQLSWKNHIPDWAWLCILTTPILSASVTLPIFLAACEGTKLTVDQKRNE
ncbi:hypothetical protein G6F56_001485 [Rhizopus delemar]|nr:hypothetical protein G6F56_001485 [Rhizopus delemar]